MTPELSDPALQAFELTQNFMDKTKSAKPGSLRPVVSRQPPKLETFEDSVALAREMMSEAGHATARQLGIKPPTLREEKTMTGVRIVVVWPDGTESNECTVDRLDDQTAHAC